MRGSPSKMASEPNVLSGCPPKMSVHVTPLFVDFQIPPVAAPTYRIAGFVGSIWRSWMRPPVPAGPIDRKCSESNGDAGACARTAVGASAHSATQTPTGSDVLVMRPHECAMSGWLIHNLGPVALPRTYMSAEQRAEISSRARCLRNPPVELYRLHRV